MTLSPTLSRIVTAAGALALVVAATPAFAVSVKDDLVSVGIKGQLQLRANILNDVTYQPAGAAASYSQDFDSVTFAARRARFGFSAKMGDNWKGNFIMRAGETAGISPNATAGGQPSDSAAVTMYYANVYYTGKTGDIEHEVGMGLDKPFTGESAISSSAYLLPTERVTSLNSTVRGYGVFYKMTGQFFALGVGLVNGENEVNAANGTAAAPIGAIGESRYNGQDKFTYTVRAEIAPGAKLWTAKKQESWAGKEGTQIVLGAEYVNNMGNDSVGDSSWYGVDLTGHWNNLSALIDYRQITNEFGGGNGALAPTAANVIEDVDSTALAIQAGWAFNLDSGYVIEPAVRYSMFDANTDNDNEASNYGTGEYGGSGNSIDLGVNWYWKGHNNKTQLAYQMWSAEDGDGDASIVRLQQSFAF